jgi:hypothetical protein
LTIKINPVLFSGSNPVHYLLCVGVGSLYGSKRQHDYSLINVVGRFGSIGILVLNTCLINRSGTAQYTLLTFISSRLAIPSVPVAHD